MKIILVTRALRDKVGRIKAINPNSGCFRHGEFRVTVTFQEWDDHYQFLSDGNVVACFTDSSLAGKLNFCHLFEAPGYKLQFDEMYKPETTTTPDQLEVTRLRARNKALETALEDLVDIHEDPSSVHEHRKMAKAIAVANNLLKQ